MNSKSRLIIWISSAMSLLIAFQVYWLYDNFVREKNALEIKSTSVFSQSFNQLQLEKFKLNDVYSDTVLDKFNDTSPNTNVNIIVKQTTDKRVLTDSIARKKMVLSVLSRKDVLQYAHNKISQKGVFQYAPTLPSTGNPQKFVITLSKGVLQYAPTKVTRDSFLTVRKGVPPPKKHDDILKLDFLEDSLRTSEIDSSCKVAFQKEHIDLPFSILRIDSVVTQPTQFDASHGISKVVTFRLQLRSTFFYLLKKLVLPILFSITLILFTGLAFWLLYKNILKQERLARENDNFISNMTHEIKTPVSTIAAAVEALQNFEAGNDKQKTAEYLSFAQNELQRLNLLIEKVLQFSKFKHAQIDLIPERLHLTQITETAISAFMPLIEKTNAQVKLEANGSLEFIGDRVHMMGAISNLLDNAIKYTTQQPCITIELSSDDSNIHFSIADNGIGIESEYKVKVFEKFFRIPQGDVHNVKGHGLGLSYVWEVIKMHKGIIQIDSKPNEGTTVHFSIPKYIDG